MKIQRIDPDRCFGDNRLYVDYVSGRGSARDFYSFAPDDYRGAFAARRGRPYPRGLLVDTLRGYNERLGAGGEAIQNIDRLADDRTMCVITGQQAGFLGGPLYTLYKIVTALRLAERCAGMLGIPVVPIFWLATDDHDMHEVDHVYLLEENGEVGRIQFPVKHDGRPVEVFPCSPDLSEVYERYFERLSVRERTGLLAGGAVEEVREVVPGPEGDRYGEWIARIWSNLFADRGLVVIEPCIMRPTAGDVFRRAVELHDEIPVRIEGAAAALRNAGYDPAPLSPQAGTLFRFDESGRRVRVDGRDGHAEVAEQPERYSADVLLRPVMVDSVLPVIAHVLGPGEIAYHAYLKPLYDLFGIAQPLLFPRKSYTVLRSVEAERLRRYGRMAGKILCGGEDVRGAPGIAIPEPGERLFGEARTGVEEVLAPILPYVEGIDPGLAKTYRRTEIQVQRALDTLRDRTEKAVMSGSAMSKGEYRRLINIIMPKGRMQERVFPLPFLLAFAGRGILDGLMEAGELDDVSHMLITVEADDE